MPCPSPSLSSSISMAGKILPLLADEWSNLSDDFIRHVSIQSTLYENPILVFSEMKLHSLVSNSYIHVSLIFERFICSQDQSAYLAAAKYSDRSWEYINRSQKHKCENWETEHYNSVWEITRLQFLEIYINQNQIFIMESHWSFICSARLILFSYLSPSM